MPYEHDIVDEEEEEEEEETLFVNDDIIVNDYRSRNRTTCTSVYIHTATISLKSCAH